MNSECVTTKNKENREICVVQIVVLPLDFHGEKYSDRFVSYKRSCSKTKESLGVSLNPIQGL